MNALRASLALLVVCVAAGSALGQRDAASKIVGGGYNFYSGSTYNRHARDHARVLNYYGQAAQSIPKEIAQEHSTAVRNNLEASRRSYSQLRKTAPQNKAVQQHLDAIEKHHQAALAMCDKLDAECAKDSADHVTVANCCLDIDKSLRAADQEAAKLHKQLQLEQPAAAPAHQH